MSRAGSHRFLAYAVILGAWSLCLGAHSPSVFGQEPTRPSLTRNAGLRVHAQEGVVPASATVITPAQVPPSIPMKSRSERDENRLATPKSSWSSALPMVFSLTMVVCLFLIAAAILRKAQPRQFQKLPKELVDVLGRSSVGPRQHLVVVRFGSKLVLVSQQPGETRTIAEITDVNEADRLAGLCESQRPESISNSFRDVFRQVAGVRNA